MSDLRQSLRSEFADLDYRYAYAESFLNTKIATQIKTLREQRRKKQSELGAAVGTKQSGFSRFEDVNHSVWKTDTLWKIARALDVRLNISFETFGSLIDEKEHFTKESLQRSGFEDDPVFKEPQEESASATIAVWNPYYHSATGLLSPSPEYFRQALDTWPRELQKCLEANYSRARTPLGLAGYGEAQQSPPAASVADHEEYMKWFAQENPLGRGEMKAANAQLPKAA
jgi:transcriptional regulator with XRE-family HTH domain